MTSNEWVACVMVSGEVVRRVVWYILLLIARHVMLVFRCFLLVVFVMVVDVT